jgi:hypothetical protein
MAGKVVFGARTLRSTRHTRLWLHIRMQAWRLGIAFESQQLTPNFLAQIQPVRCPVTRQMLQGVRAQDDTLTLVRLNSGAGYAAGNVAAISQRAAQAWEGLGVRDCVRLAHQTGQAEKAVSIASEQASRGAQASRTASAPVLPGKPEGAGIDAAGWWRLAALRSFATPLPFAVAAGLPLAVLPPNRVRLLNAVQGLQALLTRSFGAPGWSERCRRFAQWLPAHTLRQDFNLFVGAMAPRVLEAGKDPADLRQVLEDAWLNERVQRRWQHFALQLGEAGTEALLHKATEAGLAGVRTVNHAPEQATDGWALSQTDLSSSRGQLKPWPRLPVAPAPSPRASQHQPVARASTGQALLC